MGAFLANTLRVTTEHASGHCIYLSLNPWFLLPFLRFFFCIRPEGNNVKCESRTFDKLDTGVTNNLINASSAL